MKKLDAVTISINGARQIAKVIQEAPETAKKIMEKLEASPTKVSVEKVLREIKAESNPIEPYVSAAYSVLFEIDLDL
ncbi:hypothetical protein RG963_15290 [Methanosarcina sp. Z-7115]|uniref:Uncharacterized protein n=1 Tax=Methanosarcina baikalica TaxID=3073890 RepID=A0ABU2D563_9EURY|nr:hypothetical protein [Methanosarcina sp. Z-7115]MDR7667113.1 hypothetical protein [Methanosarcina sp. Z-7115]